MFALVSFCNFLAHMLSSCYFRTSQADFSADFSADFHGPPLSSKAAALAGDGRTVRPLPFLDILPGCSACGTVPLSLHFVQRQTSEEFVVGGGAPAIQREIEGDGQRARSIALITLGGGGDPPVLRSC